MTRDNDRERRRRSPWEEFKAFLKKEMQRFHRQGFSSPTDVKRTTAKLKRLGNVFLQHAYEQDRRMLAGRMTQAAEDGIKRATLNLPSVELAKSRTIRQLTKHAQVMVRQRLKISEDLIKTSREEALATMQRRFAGWASAQTPGQGTGPRIIRNLAQIEDHVMKPISAQSFEWRRLIIDQSAKLAENINEAESRDAGAIAVEWEAYPGRINYNHRPAHLARQGHIFILKDTWATQEGLVKKGKYGWYEDLGNDRASIPVFCQCKGNFLFTLGELPKDCLTEKGKEKLVQAKKRN